jgi:hypothetical protein
MPRRIDYVGRFEFIRQACFAVVRDEGPEALSRRRVATELGSGVNTIRRLVAEWADLARLAADHVVARRRAGRLHPRTDDPMEAVGHMIRSLMPEDASHLDEELVWLKLVACYGLTPSGLEPPGHVRREFGIAQRGYDIDLLEPVLGSTEPSEARGGDAEEGDAEEGDAEEGDAEEGDAEEGDAGVADRRDVLRPYFDRHLEDLQVVIGRVLDLVECPEPREEAATLLLAVIEGLTLAACIGRISPEDATDLAIRFATDQRFTTDQRLTTDQPLATDQRFGSNPDRFNNIADAP